MGLAYCIVRFENLNLSNSGRLGCIDGMRGVLALGVLCHHYVHVYVFQVSGQWTPDHSRFYTVIGPAGVFIFFMITGFLFWNKLLGQSGAMDWRKLYIWRVFRVVPLYWSAVALITVMVFSVGPHGLQVSPSELLLQITDWLFLYGTPNINAFAGTARIVAKVTWTLRYEWLFYLSLPCLAWVLRLSNRLPVALWLLAGGVLGLAVAGIRVPVLEVQTSFGFYFLIGALVAAANRSGRWQGLAQSRWLSLVVIAAGGVLLTCFDTAYGFRAGLLIALIFAPIALGNSLFGLLVLRPFLLLGEMSYSIYLLHGVILYLAFDGLFPHFMSTSTPTWALAAGLAAVAGVTVLISWASYHLIEKPCIDWGHRLARRPAMASQTT